MQNNVSQLKLFEIAINNNDDIDIIYNYEVNNDEVDNDEVDINDVVDKDGNDNVDSTCHKINY